MTPERRRAILRIARFLLLLSIALAAAYAIRTFGMEMIPDVDPSLDPTYPPGSRLVYRRVDADEKIERGTDVLYAMEKDGVAYARFGRLQGLPGDEIGAEGGFLTVNGELVGPFRIPGRPMGRVPAGKVFVLALRPSRSNYPDSRQLGFIDREDVQGVILFRLGG